VLLTRLAGARVLHRDPRAAGDFRITPDEVESAPSAWRSSAATTSSWTV